MLSIEQAQAMAGRVSYKQGWTFDIYQGRHEGVHCTISAALPDAYDQGQTLTIHVETFLSPNDMADADALITWMLYRASRIEVHEAREFLRLDGTPWSDPHADGADQDR